MYEIIRYTNMLGVYGGREQIVYKTKFKIIAWFARFFFLEKEYDEQFVLVSYRKTYYK